MTTTRILAAAASLTSAIVFLALPRNAAPPPAPLQVTPPAQAGPSIPPPPPQGEQRVTSTQPQPTTRAIASQHGTRGANPIQDFDAWVASYLSAPSPAEKATLADEGLQLARERRTRLKQLIQDDPARALAAALPFRTRQALPAPIADLLETRVSARAPLSVIYAKPPDGQPCDGRTTIRFARVGDTFFYVHAYGRRKVAASHPSVALLGVAVDDQLALAEDPFRLLDAEETQALRQQGGITGVTCPVCGDSVDDSETPAIVDVGGETVALCNAAEVPAYFQTPDGRWIWSGGGTGGTGVPSPVNPATRTQGEIRFLFMRCRFADENATSEPSTDLRVRQDLDAVMRSYAEMSYGTLQGRYSFTPTLTLPKPRSGYMNGWSDVDGMTALMKDAKALAAAIVENGIHPYDPANFDDFAARWNGEPGGCCSYGGGGDTWIRWDGPDVLVHEWGHAIGLPHANFWNPSTDDPIGPGSHEEYGNSFDAMGSGGSRHFSAMFKAQLNWIPDTNYWNVTSNGTYRIFAHDQATLTPANRYGARISRMNHEDFAYWLEYRANTISGTDEAMWTNGVTVTRDLAGELIDVTPGTSRGRDDSPLVLGRTFSDLRGGIHITPVARGVSAQPYVDVTVTLDDGRPNSQPVNVLTASTLTPSSGLPVLLNCIASDPDMDRIAYSWDFGDGTTSFNNLPNQSKTYSAAGIYVVRCTATDMRGGVCTDSVTLKVGSPAEYTVAGRITTPDGRPVANAMVRDGNGRLAYSCADGTYTLARLPSGTHILTAVRDGAALTPAYRAVTVPANQSGIDFVAPAPLEPGHGLRRDYWLNLSGSTISTLTASSRYPGMPDGTRIIADAFEGPVDWAESYGARYRGYFIPPMNGGYVFYIASDDASELRISRDTNTTSTTRIAYVTGWTSERAWTANASQKSVMLQLAAGQRYYMEALHKEGGGGDHLSVGVDLPDGTQSRPAPAAYFEPYTTNGMTPPALVGVTTPSSTVLEGGAEPGRFVFTRTGPTNAALPIQFILRGTASYASDYAATGLTAEIPAGAASVELIILPTNDTAVENPESVVATVVAGPGYIPDTAGSASITIQDNDGSASVSIVAASAVASRAGPTPARLTLRRTGPPTSELAVSLSIGGTAVNGVDYRKLESLVTIPAGASFVDLLIEPTPMPGFGLSKTVQVTVTTLSGYAVGSPGSVSIAIVHPGPGFALQRESWTDVSGGVVSALTNDGRFPASPSAREYLTAVFEGPHDAADNYGARYRGCFVAPATGSYYFSIASDDASELWLGTNALATSRRRIAYVTGSVGFRAWTAQSNQKSAAQALVAGRRYYIEALHTEGAGGDHLSVGVLMPGGISEYPMTIQWLEPYSPNGPVVLASAPIPSASEAGRAGRFSIKRAGDPSATLAVSASITGTAQYGVDYTLSPSLGVAPYWVRIERAGATITGYASPDGTNWARTGSATFTNLPASLLVGMAVSTRNNSILSTSVVEQVSISAPDGPWSSTDIGTGVAGKTAFADGSFTIVASGTDIAGAVDSLRFVYRQISGDVQITARVSSQGATDGTAKTGLMIRESLASGARHATVATTPRTFINFIQRTTTSATAQSLAAPVIVFPPGGSAMDLDVIPRADASVEGVESIVLTLLAAPGYGLGYSDSAAVNIEAMSPVATLSGGGLTLTEGEPNPPALQVSLSAASYGPVTIRYQASGSAHASDRGVLPGTVTLPPGTVTATIPITGLEDGFLEHPETVLIGLLPGSGYELSTSRTGQATILDATPMSLPAPWALNDIGDTGLGSGVAPGAASFDLQGAGTGAAGTSDTLAFLSQPIGREGALTVRLSGQTGEGAMAAAGIMIRESLDPGATHLFLAGTPSRGCVVLDRPVNGGAVRERPGGAGSATGWLRVVRSNDTVTAWRSEDGLSWSQVAASTFTGWPDTVQIGLAATSGDLSSLNTASFQDVTTVERSPARLQARVGADGTSLELSWPDSLGNVVVQSTDSLLPPVTWTPVSADSSVSEGNRRMTLPNDAPVRFYRLQMP